MEDKKLGIKGKRQIKEKRSKNKSLTKKEFTYYKQNKLIFDNTEYRRSKAQRENFENKCKKELKNF